jgi:hypothetical protein
MKNADEMGVDETQLLGIVIASIPAKPLAQAKLKCGGFFIAAIAPRRWT